MRRMLLSGIILLLIGLTFLIISASMRNVKKVTVKSEPDSWEVSENLIKGNTYIMDIMSSYQWRDDYTYNRYTEPQPVDVVIISPDEDETELQAFFIARLPTNPLQMSTLPSLIHVEYRTVDSDSLEEDESYPQIRFTIMQEGNYTVHIIEETLNWTRGPPREIIIYKEVVENVNPIVAPSGGILCLVGVVISFIGARTTKKLAVKKRKTSSTVRQFSIGSPDRV